MGGTEHHGTNFALFIFGTGHRDWPLFISVNTVFSGLLELFLPAL